MTFTLTYFGEKTIMSETSEEIAETGEPVGYARRRGDTPVATLTHEAQDGSAHLAAAPHQQAQPGPLEPAAAEAPEPPTYVTVTTLLMTVLLVSILVSTLSIVVYDRKYSLHLASFDFPKHAAALQDQLAAGVSAGKMTLEQAGQASLQDTLQLKANLGSLPPNVLVISGDVVLNRPKRLTVLPDPLAALQGGGDVPQPSQLP